MGLDRREAFSAALTVFLLVGVLSSSNSAYVVSIVASETEVGDGGTVVFTVDVEANGGFTGGEGVNTSHLVVVNPDSSTTTLSLTFQEYLGGLPPYGNGSGYDYYWIGYGYGYTYGDVYFGRLRFNASFTLPQDGDYLVFLYVNDVFYRTMEVHRASPPTVVLNSPSQSPKPELNESLSVNLSLDGTGSALSVAKYRFNNSTFFSEWRSFLERSNCSVSLGDCVFDVSAVDSPLGNVTLSFSVKDAFGLWNNSTFLEVESNPAIVLKNLVEVKPHGGTTGYDHIRFDFNVTLRGGDYLRMRMSNISGPEVFSPVGMVYITANNSTGFVERYNVSNDYNESVPALRPRDEDPSTPWVDALVSFVLEVPGDMDPGDYSANYSIGMYSNRLGPG